MLEVLGSDAGHPFCKFFGVHSSVVVHEVVGCGLGDVVLGLVMHDLVVDSALGTLKLLIADLVRIVYIG